MRICEQLSEENEESLARIAESILRNLPGDWLQHSEPPGRMSNPFVDTYLVMHGLEVEEATRPQIQTCLFRLLARADAQITVADEEKLRSLYRAHRDDNAFWPGHHDHHEKLEKLVREAFSDQCPSAFRLRVLVNELGNFFVGITR